jgi:hypothetical protein
MAIPANQLPIGEGATPDGTGRATFFVDLNVLWVLEQQGPEWKHQDARFVPEAVDVPDAIFAGLKRHGREGALCYSVRPTIDPEVEECQSLPRYGYVFIAFVEPCVGGFIVFDWDWREEDPDRPGHPLNWEEDFEKPTWQR